MIFPGGVGGTGGAGGTTSFNQADGNDSSKETAFVLGIGTEVKLNDKLSLGLEGLYYFFDDDVGRLTIEHNGTQKTYTDGDGGFYSVKARLTYRFGERHQ